MPSGSFGCFVCEGGECVGAHGPAGAWGPKTVHVLGIPGDANDVEDFFVGLLDLLSDERRCYPLICRLHQSYAAIREHS